MTESKADSKIRITPKMFIIYLCIFYVPFFVSWVTLVNLQVFDVK